VPFVFVEWICWRVSPFLEQLAFLKVLEHLGRLAVLIAVVFYFTESGSRRKAKHYQAWQVINLAQGKTGSGGRMDALQDLYGDGISLAGVDISKAYLPNINLKNADLKGANLSEAILRYTDFSGAKFSQANLSGADLFDANLSGASLADADLSGADLRYADLSGAYLPRANLSGADLLTANLSGAYLYEANLKNSNIDSLNLQEITSLVSANIYGVKNSGYRFIEWAKEHGAVSIEDDEEWKKLIREKRQEETKQKQ